VVDGISRRVVLSRSCKNAIETEVVKIADAYKTNRSEVLRSMWREIGALAQCEWAFGRSQYVSEAAVLLAFMRELPPEGGRLAESLAHSSEEAPEDRLRNVRAHTGEQPTTARSSCERGLERQPSDEPSNALCQLSQVLALAANTRGLNADAYRAFPLSLSSPGRVGQLRAYGNAIVPQVAAQFVTAFMEAAQ
jgi:hypothetical protein